MHSANRFEIKYLTDLRRTMGVRAEVGRHLRRDPDAASFGPLAQYQVWSCYYDTAGLRSYWEKLDGVSDRRRLRVRTYGPADRIGDATPAWVEIKHRTDRVIRKHRARMPYAEALALCRGVEPEHAHPDDVATVERALAMAAANPLRPVVAVGYSREAFVGPGGLRITIDSHIRGRDRDLHLAWGGGRPLIDADLAVVEIKVDDVLPRWVADMVARHDLHSLRLSKYCLAIEAVDGMPRSLSHAADDLVVAPPAVAC